MRKEILFLLTGLLMMNFVFAGPGMPSYFSGTVTYSVEPLRELEGSDISASIGGYGLGVVGEVDSGNLYAVIIESQGRSGEIIFYVGGIEAHPKTIYDMDNDFVDLDLIIDEEPLYAVCGNDVQEPGEQCDGSMLGVGTCENVLGIAGATGTLSCTNFCTFDYSNCFAPSCGDGICGDGESCSSCTIDCGVCSSGDDGGSSGGGSSGGSSSGSSSESSVLSSSEDEENIEEFDVADLTETSEENEEADEPFGFFSMFTGAIIGGGIGNWLIALVLIGLILLLYFIVKKEMSTKKAVVKRKAPVKKKAPGKKKIVRKK